MYARFTSWTSLIFVNMWLHSAIHFKQVLTEADNSPLYHSPLSVKWLECQKHSSDMSRQSDIMMNGVYPCVSLKEKKKALKLFLALTIAMNTISLFLAVCLTHTLSQTGSDEGSRPSNESKCPFPWQLQILESQNKEIHHCFCNNWLFLPDYSWPKMATTAKSCLGKWHTATDMGIHLHIKISTNFRKVMTVQPWFVCIMLMVVKGEKSQGTTLSALPLCFNNFNYTFSYSILLFHTWTCVIRSKVPFFFYSELTSILP